MCCWHGGTAWQVLLVVALATIGLVAAEGQTRVEEGIIESSCEQSECLRCDLSTGRCLKCRYAIMDPSRECVTRCPAGHAPSWRQDGDYQGTVCTPGSLLAGITGRDIAVIACAAAGGAVCVGIILGAILYARRHAMLKPMPEEETKKIPVPRMWRDPRPSAADTSVGTDERKQFLQALSVLRKDTGLLLEMLAETRTRSRGIGGPDHNMDSKALAYRAVVRDLSRVVSLIARREETFQSVPADWRRLLAWADRLLQRYRRTRDNKCPGCELQHPSNASHTKQSNDILQKPGASVSCSQPLFRTRQQTLEERWRKQREEADRSGQDTQRYTYSVGSEFDLETVAEDSYVIFNPTILEKSITEQDHHSEAESCYSHVDPKDIEISYTQDEEALANQRAQCATINENNKNEPKNFTPNSDDFILNKGKKEKGSPSMITRIFCNKLLNNNDLSSSLNDSQKNKVTIEQKVIHDEECLSSTSIYDHIEAFTFDDFASGVKPEVKPVITKSKPKNAHVNTNRLRKANFPGYSESFKQILDKKNLLNINRTKIQKRLSRKGEQLNKMVRRSESRFLKDKNKLDPNMTYDRRNCKNNVVNQKMIGGDVYVSVVKQPVVEREQTRDSGSYTNFNDLESVPDTVDMNTKRRNDAPQTLCLRVEGGIAGNNVAQCLRSENVNNRPNVTSTNIEIESSTAGTDNAIVINDNNIRCELLTVV